MVNIYKQIYEVVHNQQLTRYMIKVPRLTVVLYILNGINHYVYDLRENLHQIKDLSRRVLRILILLLLKNYCGA